MTPDTIHQIMEGYVKNQEMAGCALLVRKDDRIVFDGKWGYADIAAKIPITDQTVFRMASMTKVITSVAILMLMEAGKLDIDDPVCKYLPQFSDMKVCNDPRYTEECTGIALMRKRLCFRMDRVKTVCASRDITIRDLLSHASGLQQGLVGDLGMLSQSLADTLPQRVNLYSRQVLDFQPGTNTG